MIIVSCHDIFLLNELKKLDVTHILINDEYFSSGIKGLSKENLNKMIDRIHSLDMKAIVKVDRLYQQNEIEGLIEYLNFLNNRVDGLLITDLALKQLCVENNFSLPCIYAPETLLTNKYDVSVLQKDGFDSVVISKDITLEDVYDIVDNNPDYCFLRIFGPILISYSKRRFISIYLDEDKEFTDDYYLQEESRDMLLPIIEKKSGSWLYGPTLQSLDSIKELISHPFKGLIIDGVFYDDNFVVEVVRIYKDVIDGTLDYITALERLKGLNDRIEYIGLSDIKKTWLDKE